MKKSLFFLFAAALLTGACATADTTTATTANQTLTLEQALQKSAETRQQLEQAKQAYQTAKTASEIANGSKTVSQALQDQVQKQLNTTATQLENEKKCLG